MFYGVMSLLKNAITRFLPRPTVQFLKKLYYPYTLKIISEQDWPCSIVVKHVVRRGDNVIDVGANIGYVSALLSRWVGLEGRVYSLEPIPETFALLDHNVRKLGLRNVQLYQCAASSREGRALMEIPRYTAGGENFYQSHIVQSDREKYGGRTVSVELRRLDSLFPRDRIRFIKIDAEGHELDVVRGAEALIMHARPAMLIEVCKDPDLVGSEAYSLFALLLSRAYQPYLLEQGRLRPRRPGDKAIDYFFFTEQQTNYLRTQRLL